MTIQALPLNHCPGRLRNKALAPVLPPKGISQIAAVPLPHVDVAYGHALRLKADGVAVGGGLLIKTEKLLLQVLQRLLQGRHSLLPWQLRSAGHARRNNSLPVTRVGVFSAVRSVMGAPFLSPTPPSVSFGCRGTPSPRSCTAPQWTGCRPASVPASYNQTRFRSPPLRTTRP